MPLERDPEPYAFKFSVSAWNKADQLVHYARHFKANKTTSLFCEAGSVNRYNDGWCTIEPVTCMECIAEYAKWC